MLRSLFILFMIFLLSCSDKSASPDGILIMNSFDIKGQDSLIFQTNISSSYSRTWQSSYLINAKNFEKIVFKLNITVECDTILDILEFYLGTVDENGYYEYSRYQILEQGENYIDLEIPDYLFISDNIYFRFNEYFSMELLNKQHSFPLTIINSDLEIIGYK